MPFRDSADGFALPLHAHRFRVAFHQLAYNGNAPHPGAVDDERTKTIAALIVEIGALGVLGLWSVFGKAG